MQVYLSKYQEVNGIQWVSTGLKFLILIIY